MTTPTRLDHQALKAGASVTLMLAVPPTLIARFVLDTQNNSSGWAPFLTLIAVAGFVIGAGVAAQQQTRLTPLLHGVTASTGSFLVVQAALVLAKLLLRSDIRFGRMLTSLTVSLVASVVGSLLGMFVANQTPQKQ
ncbi:MAG: hypothetical protein EXQ63_04235 [Ilumatobacteraceae bacterium]|nr:hypothetical protein [Ilumatobacteraceae bacterium]